jgi:hypothetical protein
MTWLGYPSPHLSETDPSAWNYVMSACVACQSVQRDTWFVENVDTVLITPLICDPLLKAMFGAMFDTHVEYIENLQCRPPPGFTKEPIGRWADVFNKLCIFNPDVFPYKRVLLTDAEVIVKDFRRYQELFSLTGDFLGVSESHTLPGNMGHHRLPSSYGSFDQAYAHVNAGLILVTPNTTDFFRLKALLCGGWDFCLERMPQMRHRSEDTLDLWCPEQELLTCFFRGRTWHLGPRDDFLSLHTTSCHWSFDHHGHKIWKFPELDLPLSALYVKLLRDWLARHPRFRALPHVERFLGQF